MNTTLNVCDRIGLSTRTVTEEGYLIVPSTLARTGVQEYRAYELGLDADGMDPMRVLRLHRPADEVFNPASMASFENKPVTLGHPDKPVTSDNWAELAKGDVREVRRAGDLMTGKITVKSRSAIDAIEAGTVELSNGYTFKLDMTPGTAPDGKAYDGIQRNIRGNHVALVESARCGSVCRLGDALGSVSDRAGLVGRAAFVERQRIGSDADATKLDEKGVARAEQAAEGAAAIAAKKPTGRAAFLHRQAAAWQQGGDK
jgi:hypothetical protein